MTEFGSVYGVIINIFRYSGTARYVIVSQWNEFENLMKRIIL